MVGQTSKSGDNIPGNVDRPIEVESTVVVTADNEFDRYFFRPTKACHQWCVRVVEEGSLLDFFSGLGHPFVYIGPFLDFCLEFLPLAILNFGIFDVL